MYNEIRIFTVARQKTHKWQFCWVVCLYRRYRAFCNFISTSLPLSIIINTTQWDTQENSITLMDFTNLAKARQVAWETMNQAIVTVIGCYLANTPQLIIAYHDCNLLVGVVLVPRWRESRRGDGVHRVWGALATHTPSSTSCQRWRRWIQLINKQWWVWDFRFKSSRRAKCSQCPRKLVLKG